MASHWRCRSTGIGAPGADAFRGLAQARHVDPLLGRRRACMHEQHVVVAYDERQAFEKRALSRAELRLRPRDGRLRGVAQRIVRAPEHGRIVIAEHDDRPVSGVLLDQFEHCNGIGTVAHQIAKECVTIRSQAASVREAGGDRLQVAVDVGEECQLHWRAQGKRPDCITRAHEPEAAAADWKRRALYGRVPTPAKASTRA